MSKSQPLSRCLLISRHGVQDSPKKPWAWVLVENGERQYTSWRSFSSKAKAEAHFFSGSHGITHKQIKVGVEK